MAMQPTTVSRIMAKHPSEATTKTKTYNYDYADPKYGVTKGSARYDPDEWEAFEKICEQRGIPPTSQIRKFVREFTDGRLVELSELKPETLGEVQKRANELGLELRTLVAQIIAEWVATRRQERSKKK